MIAHKTKKVCLNGVFVDIDEDIVDLVVALNNTGLKTLFSCQGDKDYPEGEDEEHAAHVVFGLGNGLEWCNIQHSHIELLWFASSNILNLVSALRNQGLVISKHEQGDLLLDEPEPAKLRIKLNRNMYVSICNGVNGTLFYLGWRKIK